MKYYGRKRLVLFVIPTALACFAELLARAGAALPGTPPPATSHLTLGTNGLGRLVCSFPTNLLEIGRRYMIRAIPAAGQIFSSWEGGITSAANPLFFTMQSNMVLTADFVPNPFLALRGQYNGLFYPGNEPGSFLGGVNRTNSGAFTLTLTAQGRFSGKLLTPAARIAFAGEFGPDLQAQLDIPWPGQPALAVTLQLDLSRPPLQGLVVSPSGTSELLAYRSAPGVSNAYAGSYTLLEEVCTDCIVPESVVPRGDGPAAVAVSPSGVLRMYGTLADGSPVSHSAIITPEGLWPLYIPLYGGGGLLIGWMNLNTNVQDEALVWVKPASVPGTRHYIGGFFLEIDTLLTKYTAPSPSRSALNWTNGTVIIGGGNLPNNLTNQVWLSSNHIRALDGNPNHLSLTINSDNGVFQGTFIHPSTGRLTDFRGAVVQLPPTPPPPDGPQGSSGWFLGPTEAGFIRLEPFE